MGKKKWSEMTAAEKTAKLKKSKDYANIKSDLLEQLEVNGTEGRHFTDLVEDYMTLWVTKSLLSEDVRERGVYIQYDNGGGQSGTRKNDSVDQLLKTNAQMLKLLSELGIKPTNGAGDPGDL